MSQTKDVWITTVDNPFDPFTQWDRWFNFDEQQNYKTCERVARFAHVNRKNLTEKENNDLIDQAIVRVYLLYGPQVYQIVVEGETTPW